jgi:hypothetical protein
MPLSARPEFPSGFKRFNDGLAQIPIVVNQSATHVSTRCCYSS